MLDGSHSECAPNDDAAAPAPGIFALKALPAQFRRDDVNNSNDSHWTANNRARLEGYPRIMGPERTARSLRTRIGLHLLEDRLNGADGAPGKSFTLEQLIARTMNNHVYAGEMWRDALVGLCKTAPQLATHAEACAALAGFMPAAPDLFRCGVRCPGSAQHPARPEHGQSQSSRGAGRRGAGPRSLRRADERYAAQVPVRGKEHRAHSGARRTGRHGRLQLHRARAGLEGGRRLARCGRRQHVHLLGAVHRQGAAAAIANLKIVREENLPANAAAQGAYLLEQLKPFERCYRAVGDVRGKGLMIALDLVKDRATREPIDPEDGYASAVAAATRAAGALVRPVGTKIILSPPLILHREQADALVTALDAGFREVG